MPGLILISDIHRVFDPDLFRKSVKRDSRCRGRGRGNPTNRAQILRWGVGMAGRPHATRQEQDKSPMPL